MTAPDTPPLVIDFGGGVLTAVASCGTAFGTEHITVLRMVIRESFSREMVDMLAADVRSAFSALSGEKRDGPQPPRTRLRPHC